MYLNIHTYYSLRYGTLSCARLLDLAQANGCKELALTDINGTSACIDFVRMAKSRGIKPIIGVDFRNGVQQQFVAIAKNNNGFEEINQHLTTLMHSKKKCAATAPGFKNTFVIYPFYKQQPDRELKAHEYIGVRVTDLPYLRLHQLPTKHCVILHTVSFETKKDFNAHRLLRAIDLNTVLSKLPRSEEGKETDQMWPVAKLAEAFADYPEIIENTQQILDAATIDFDFSPTRSENQKYYTETEEEDWELLQRLCEEGLHYRYPDASDRIKERVQKELTTIRQMNFVSYFLINWDIVSYARSKGYYHVGRGSGANSIIAYLLKITDVDPVELDLYFERFINLFRKNPPDFDIDFSWTDRDDVMRYIFERFPNVALVATYNTFSNRSVVRELGKVFGLPKEEIDKLIRPVGAPEFNHLSTLVLKYSRYIHGFPSHLSLHASGMIISERPIQYFSPTFLSQKGYPTIQFDMHIAEDIGWYKFDILSQRGLSKIKDSLAIIAKNRPDAGEIDIHDIQRFKQDERIKHLLREADAIGCFYVESPAMRMLLRKLRVDDYLGLVAASSVIRPGVAQSGMMQEYIKRYRHPERRKEVNKALYDLMPETYGVMVYQEDVIKVAHYFAGLSLDEADKMRRGMSGKYRSREEFDQVRDKFFKNSVEVMGRDAELTAEVWRQTASFAGYAFAKGHSASYAVESYQCLFLKAYYPLEFLVATINNYGGFYSTELYVYEARRLGGIIEPICINRSCYETVIEGKTIYLGFHLLHSLETKVAQRIERDRLVGGPFLDVEDFIERVRISLEQISLLIRINAFRFSGRNKRELLWEAHMRINPDVVKREQVGASLFNVKTRQYEVPKLSGTEEEDAFDQIELLGFTLDSYFKLITSEDTQPILKAKELVALHGQHIWVKGYVIHVKKTQTLSGADMCFGTLLDEEGEWLDTVHFPDVMRRYPFRGKGVYRIFGKVTVEYDCVTVEAEYLEKLSVMEDPRYAVHRLKENEKQLETSNVRLDYWDRARKKITDRE